MWYLGMFSKHVQEFGEDFKNLKSTLEKQEHHVPRF